MRKCLFGVTKVDFVTNLNPPLIPVFLDSHAISKRRTIVDKRIRTAEESSEGFERSRPQKLPQYQLYEENALLLKLNSTDSN